MVEHASDTERLKQFRVRRRIALWLGVLTPAMLLIAALVIYQRFLASGWFSIACLGLAVLLMMTCGRAYRCPFCGGDPEEGEDVGTFFPKACSHCGAQLR